MTTPTRKSTPIRRREPSDPAFKAVELAQRGRMILDVAAADLEAAETTLGPFHPTSWHFREALAEARRSWDRLRAEFGGAALAAALEEPPLAVLTLRVGAPGLPAVTLIPIGGSTYRAERVAGTELAPVLWRLTRCPPATRARITPAVSTTARTSATAPPGSTRSPTGRLPASASTWPPWTPWAGSEPGRRRRVEVGPPDARASRRVRS
jgi:hypothetical protein